MQGSGTSIAVHPPGSGGDISTTASHTNLDSHNLETPSTERKKPNRRRCLRLDLKHVREVFVTVFYRIWMYRKRHILTTLLQLLIPPLILVGMTAYLGTLLELEKKDWTHYKALDEAELLRGICDPSVCTSSRKGVIAAFMTHSKNQFSTNFVQELKQKLQTVDIDLVMVNKRSDLLSRAIRHHLTGTQDIFIAGIEIENPKATPGKYGVGKSFVLDFTVSMAHPVPGFEFKSAPVFFDLSRNDPKLYNQLLGVEIAVFRSFYHLAKMTVAAATATTSPDPVSIEVQALSYPPHKAYTLKSDMNEDKPKGNANPSSVADQTEFEGIDSMLATIFVLSMIPVCFTVVEAPVTEKEHGFKLYLQLMGFPRGAYWFHWILNQMILQLVVIAFQVWLIFYDFDPKTGALVKYGDPMLWLIVLILYNLACLSFFTFFAAFCHRGKMGTYITILIWLISFQILQSHVFDLGSEFSVFMLSCLIPSGCIHWAVYILTTVNSNTWDISVNFLLTQKSGFRLSDVIIMLVLNFFIYFLLTLYVDNLHPGPMEVGQPWNYFFESIRCRFIDPNKDRLDKTPVPSGTDIRRRRKYSKDAAQSLKVLQNYPSIEVKKLSKMFYLVDGVFGIERVQFKAYPGAITVLLGHKDSGRTTIIRLLCGAYAPTSGTVIVFDYNVRRDVQKVQSFLSVCTENNMLCVYLTVMEHMQLIAKLKGVSSKDAKEDAKTILESVGLLSQQNDMLWKLAKWQCRVLCVAMALIGEAPILLLDEPTFGLDLDAKRQIWGLLKDLKVEGKTILMSTQDIDEAYQVADKIVLMTRGRVAGVGAPSRLESILETGYHLYLETIPDAKPEEILVFLRGHVSTAKQLEGSLKRMQKAIETDNWEQQSQAGLVSLRHRWTKSKTVINMQDQSRGSKTKDNSTEVVLHMKPRPSGTNNRASNDNEQGNNPPRMELRYLLPAEERANYQALFKALDDGKSALQLGIKAYDLKWHSIETAFEEIDDYVDVLDATRTSQEMNLDDLEEGNIDGLKLLINERTHEPMPKHKFLSKKKCCISCWPAMWAIIIKRVFYAMGNWRHALCQSLAPLIILLISITSTDVHFGRQLLSPEIIYNTSTELLSPKLPYRFDPNAGSEAKKFLHSFQKVAGQAPNYIKRFDNMHLAKFTDRYNEKTLYRLHDEVVIAADFTRFKNGQKKVVTALYSPGHHHSAPLSLLLMFNSLLDYEFTSQGYNYRISMTGRSMLHRKQIRLMKKSELAKTIRQSGADITLTVALAFGYFIFSAGFVVQPCSERLCKLKRYQMYNLEWNGLYWLAIASVDGTFNFLLTLMMTLVIYYAPEHDIFKNPQFIILFIFTGTFGGFACIIASYYWSHYMLKKATAYYATLSIYQFFGLFLFLLYTIFNFEYLEIPYLGTIVAHTLEILQPFTIPWNFYEGILWALENGRCRALHSLVYQELCSTSPAKISNSEIVDLKKECCSNKPDDWSLTFIFDNSNWIITPLWSNVTFLMAHAVVGILVLMVKESRRFRRNFFLTANTEAKPAIINASDMAAIKNEEQFVKEDVPDMNPEARAKLFIVENLSTSTSNRTLLHPMTFAVEPGKCTVIAGPETSGITTLYHILAGLRAVSEGSVSYGGSMLFAWGTRRKFLQQLGLSPSQDITLDKISGYQLLALFARLRGISRKDLKRHIDYWVNRLSLQSKIKKNCESYSIINKRKLSIACAVIGNPSVLIFDEPTRDLDPLSKSEVLHVLTSLICANRVVIILTHDLASVQNLCSKLIILVNGQMQFCEKIENIEEEIAEEFILTIKLKGDDSGKIDFKTFTAFVTELEEGIESMSLQDEQSYMLVYRIKNAKYNWANLFETVESVVVKHQGVVLDYNIRKTSLADLYQSYASKQRVFRTNVSVWDEFRTTYC